MSLLCSVGGFLGAGKTTLLCALAKELLRQGKTVALVTNDQGSVLIDTAFLKSQGLSVLEVTQGCFCCRYPDLLDRLHEHQAHKPDYILVEPSGSCTDLAAAVLRPLLKEPDLQLLPLSVCIAPLRLSKFLKGKGFDAEINYLFDRQLQEGDYLLLNHSDTLSEEEKTTLRSALKTKYPQAKVLCISAKTGEGLMDWFAGLAPTRDFKSMTVDYRRYAKGEAALGWVDMTAKNKVPVDGEKLDALLMDLAGKIDSQGGLAHLKCWGMTAQGVYKANLTDGQEQLHTGEPFFAPPMEGVFLLSIRAKGEAEALHKIVEEAMGEFEILQREAFSPKVSIPPDQA